jgi:hypothetical protein
LNTFSRAMLAEIIVNSGADSAPKFLCIAVDVKSASTDRQVLALAAKQLQKPHVAAELAAVRAKVRERRPGKLVREIINSAAARAAVTIPEGSTVTALPYRSAGIEAAAQALAALDNPPAPQPHDPEILAGRRSYCGGRRRAPAGARTHALR